MVVVNPDPFLLPNYRISPFTTQYITVNQGLPKDDFAISYFDEKMGSGNWIYTLNGREAIVLALENYQLKKDDLVTILTTSENFYISSCVTSSIEKFCRWNRELLPETKVILVNHEFGYPHPEMEKIVATRLPIIEDCCTTFFSQDKNQKVGKYGDFAIYSFPKFFPIQIGGLLVSNTNKKPASSSVLAVNQKNYIQNVVSNQLKNESSLLKQRKQNFVYAVKQFSRLGFTLRFPNTELIFPSALLLNNNAIIGNLNELKNFLSQSGIQSSVFYGEDAFFIPCHQSLSAVDIDLIFETIAYFIAEKESI